MVKYIGRFYFVSSHDCALQSHSDGEMHASQKVQNIGKEERWNVYVWPDGKISLQNFLTNKWLCAEPSSGKAICDRSQPDDWEKWTLHGINNHVAFLSFHGRWLCAQAPGNDTQYGGEVIADRATCKEWERFSMIPAEGVQEVNNTWWNAVKSISDIATEVAPILITII